MIAVASDSKGFGVLDIGTKENLQPLKRLQVFFGAGGGT